MKPKLVDHIGAPHLAKCAIALGSDGRRYPPRATLADVRAANATRVLFYRVARKPVSSVDCRHQGKMDVDEAIKRWGTNVPLNDLPVKCSKSGGSWSIVAYHNAIVNHRVQPLVA